MKLITSGAYIQGELVSEIGLVPPAFLPIGNKRLFELQIKLMKKSKGHIYLSIPETYNIEKYDRVMLDELGVTILEVPDNISLGESILYCWNSTGVHYESLEILHGDTLFNTDFSDSTNAVSCHANKGFYNRAIVDESSPNSENVFRNEWASEGASVLSGYFHFAKPLFLMKCLLQNRVDFIKACNAYNKKYMLNIVKHGKWFDFGHVNSFFKSRSNMTTQRSFNNLAIDKSSVIKKSESNSMKIACEALWFLNLPKSLGCYTPNLLDYDIDNQTKSFYKLEYLYLLPISDLFVFGNLNKFSWQTILLSVKEMLNDFKLNSESFTNFDLNQIDEFYLSKTTKRLNEFKEISGFDINKKIAINSRGEYLSLLELAEFTNKLISPTRLEHISITHGDPCFSNLLYDSRTNITKVIDPRGVLPNGEASIYGDVRYDLAKVYHSFVGFYDFIIAGRYSLTKGENTYQIEFDKEQEVSGRLFENIFLKDLNISEVEVLSITIHLFLSMLPLHRDRPDRQDAFIANALRLHKILKRKIT